MSPNSADEPTRAKPGGAPSPKHPFDRDPLLIPQLFVDGKPPWYRQPASLAGIAAGSLMLLGTAAVVRVYSFEGLLRKFAALATR